MVTYIEFACLVVACTLTGLSYFYNKKYSYYYLQKSKAISFLAVLALQLTVLLGVRYLNVEYEIYYLLPFNIFYISVFYHALIKISLQKTPKNFLSYGTLIILFISYVLVFRFKTINNLQLYYLLYQLCLLVLLLRCIIKYIVLSKFDTNSNVSVKWYFQALVGLSIIELTLFVYNIFSGLDLFNLQIVNTLYLLFISVTMLIFMIRTVLFVDVEKLEVENIVDYNVQQHIKMFEAEVNKFEKKDKYQKSKLKEEELLMIKEKLQRIVDEKLYLDPELNLEQLSQLLKVSKYSLSQAFSSICETNFKDYINYLRCEYALQFILKENSSQNIIEIAYQSGFNSKTSFYRAFNKLYSCTPMEYKKRILN